MKLQSNLCCVNSCQLSSVFYGNWMPVETTVFFHNRTSKRRGNTARALRGGWPRRSQGLSMAALAPNTPASPIPPAPPVTTRPTTRVAMPHELVNQVNQMRAKATTTKAPGPVQGSGNVPGTSGAAARPSAPMPSSSSSIWEKEDSRSQALCLGKCRI